jgi:hypothetical protein
LHVSFRSTGSPRTGSRRCRARCATEPPEGLPATEIIVFHDREGEKSLVILFFDTEDDYRRGDEVLDAMPTGETPGQRTSVTKYDVAVRMAV